MKPYRKNLGEILDGKLVSGLLIAVMVVAAFSVALPTRTGEPDVDPEAPGPMYPSWSGSILVTDRSRGQVYEVTSYGSKKVIKSGLDYPEDAERLQNGNTLIADTGHGRVIEVTKSGYTVWEHSGLTEPVDVERTKGGTTLIVDDRGHDKSKVIEVDSSGNVLDSRTAWEYLHDAERLPSGSTLIDEYKRYDDGISEYGPLGSRLWGFGIKDVYDIEKLSNGNVLVSQPYKSQVLEMDTSGKVVWKFNGSARPYDAERLPSGNTLVADYYDGILEVTKSGNIVWSYTYGWHPVDVELIGIDNRAPVANAGGPYYVDEGELVVLDASLSYDPDGDSLKYSWDLDGDGWLDIWFSTSAIATHTWFDDYWGYVMLQVWDGVKSSTSWTEVIVSNVAPKAFLGPNIAVDEGDTVPMTAFMIDPGTLDTHTYAWDLDNDGQYDDAAGQSVSWTCVDNGVFRIRVRVSDDDWGHGYDTLYVIAANVAPTAIADITPGTWTEGLPLEFHGNQTDPGADTFTYEWDFGDSETSIEQNPTHAYTDPGVYTVTLTVTDDDGGMGVDTMLIEVSNVLPMATVSIDLNPVDEGTEVHFTGGPSDTTYDQYSHLWSFGDGGSSTGQNPAYTYMDDGAYAVSLYVEDDEGTSDTAWMVMQVDDLGPAADAGPDRTVTIIDIVTFDGSGSSSYPDSIVAYEWDFGDGESDSGMMVLHTYCEIGTYIASLTVTDNDGSAHTDTAVITVLVPGVDLLPDAVVLLPPSPEDAGINVTVSIDITNYGNTDALNVAVRFYDGDPDQNDNGIPDPGALQIGSDVVFPIIASTDTVTASVMWTTLTGLHDIYAWADPDNNIPEYDDSNNQAFTEVIIGPDLLIMTPSLFDPNPVAVGQIVDMSAGIYNGGGSTATDVVVRFYEEIPDANLDGFEDPSAVQVGDVVIPSLAPGATTTVTMSWVPISVGVYDISVWVDPAEQPNQEGLVLEAIEANNIQSDTLYVGPQLAIAFTDISFSINPVAEGTTVDMTAVIHNLGGQDAYDVVVKFYDTEVKKKNEIGAVIIPAITAGSVQTATITWLADVIGYHDVWVVVDPKDDVEEYDETDNQAYNVLSVV